MKILGLTARYFVVNASILSYQGEIGMKANNLIQRQFEASQANGKVRSQM